MSYSSNYTQNFSAKTSQNLFIYVMGMISSPTVELTGSVLREAADYAGAHTLQTPVRTPNVTYALWTRCNSRKRIRQKL